MLKRNWKTVELGDADLADFSAMGGLEIDMLSDDSNAVKFTKSKGENIDKSKAKKKKSKSKPKVVEIAEVVTPSHTSNSVDVSKWVEFGLDSRIIDGLRNLGFESPTPIQTAVIAKALTGLVDVLGAAQTGSGKTLAFGLPILHSILNSSAGPSIKALCILPTRELAVQVKDHLAAVIPQGVVYIGTVIGGMSVDKQIRVLSHKPDIVVGTPGRIAGLLGLSKQKSDLDSGTVVCPQFKADLCTGLTHLVLDEADRLLEQAHFRDLTSILSFLYESVDSSAIQSFIFSATLPVEGHEFARLLGKLKLKLPASRLVVDLTSSANTSTPATLVFKTMFPKADSDREAFLVYYLHKIFFEKKNVRIIVFVNAISYVYRLSSVLPLCFAEGEVNVFGIHSSLKQKDRLKKLDQFKATQRGILIATDLAARGLDLPKVDAVVHLQPPRTPEALIHRSGRTARAGQFGECLLLITPEQIAPWKKAIRLGLNLDIEQISKQDVVSVDIGQIREIHRLASLIEGQSHKDKRASKDKAWTKKACEETELWDSDIEQSEMESSEGEEIVGQRNSKQVKPQDYYDLANLILKPLPSKIR